MTSADLDRRARRPRTTYLCLLRRRSLVNKSGSTARGHMWSIALSCLPMKFCFSTFVRIGKITDLTSTNISIFSLFRCHFQRHLSNRRPKARDLSRLKNTLKTDQPLFACFRIPERCDHPPALLEIYLERSPDTFRFRREQTSKRIRAAMESFNCLTSRREKKKTLL